MFGGASATTAAAKPAPQFGAASAATQGSYKPAVGTGSYSAFGNPNPSFGSSQASGFNDRETRNGFGAQDSFYSMDPAHHVTNGSSVKEYAYAEDKNYRFRPQMEDSKCQIFAPNN